MPTPAPRQSHNLHKPGTALHHTQPHSHSATASARRARCLPPCLAPCWPPPVTGSRPTTLHARHTPPITLAHSLTLAMHTHRVWSYPFYKIGAIYTNIKYIPGQSDPLTTTPSWRLEASQRTGSSWPAHGRHSSELPNSTANLILFTNKQKFFQLICLI